METYYKVVKKDLNGDRVSPIVTGILGHTYKPNIWCRLKKDLRLNFQPLMVFNDLWAAVAMRDSLNDAYIYDYEIWECEIKPNKSNRKLITNPQQAKLVITNKMYRAEARLRSRKKFKPFTTYANAIRLTKKVRIAKPARSK